MLLSFIFYLVPLVICILATYVDIKERRIPDFLNFPLIAFGLAFHGLVAGSIQMSLTFAFVGGAIGLVPNLLGWDWWGGGDVKLMAGMGAVFGRASLLVLLLTFVASGVYILWENLRKGRLGEEVYLPFAPFVLIGTVGYLVFMFI